MTTYRINKEDYEVLKRIAAENDIPLHDVVYILIEYNWTHNNHKTWEKGYNMRSADAEIQMPYDRMFEDWLEEYELKPATLFALLLDEVTDFKMEYNLI